VNEIPAPPPPVHNGMLGYVQKEKIFAKPSTTRNKAPKKKEKKKIPCHRFRPSKLSQSM
jgi:hypothetical protein